MMTNTPLGAHLPQGRGGGGGGAGRCGGGGDSSGRGSDQGGQRGDVSTERLPASTRTLRGCIIGEGWLTKELIQAHSPSCPRQCRLCTRASPHMDSAQAQVSLHPPPQRAAGNVRLARALIRQGKATKGGLGEQQKGPGEGVEARRCWPCLPRGP
jgi:hypothetical protein